MVAAKGGEVFPACEPRVKCQLLRNPSQGLTSLGRADRKPEDGNAPRVGKDATNNAADQRAFARSVWPQQSQAFAATQRQRDAIDGRYRSKSLDQRSYFERDRLDQLHRVRVGVEAPGFGRTGEGQRNTFR